MPKVGDVVADKYEIEKIIGEGGMGAVFAATHKLTGKRVAMKWMLPELARDEDAVQRFMREAQAAGRINHPNVVDVYDVGKHDDSFFIVMEHLTGEPLTAALERRDLSIGEVLDLILPAMRGVAAAHRQGVVHRDLKPDNIFLAQEDGQRSIPKVLDFGISKVASAEGAVNPRLTKTGAVVGTPYYMSPEAIRGSHGVDKRSDVYAFGVILYEAFTGKVPFDAETYSALILEIATGTPKYVQELAKDLPTELCDVVMKAMAREVDNRYQDLESLAIDLEPYAETASLRTERRDPTGKMKRPLVTSATATSTPFVSEAPAAPREKTGAMFMVIAAVVVLGGAAWFFLKPSDSGAPDLHVVAPADDGVNKAATAQPAGAAPVQVKEPEVVPPPVAAPTPAPTEQAAVPTGQDTLPEGASAPAAPTENPREAADKGRRSGHRVKPTAATPTTTVTPTERAPSGRARSGTLTVDDF